MLIGYARVSTQEQDTSLQIQAFKALSITTIYSENTSSVGKRPQLQIALGQLQKDDILVVYKLDRLARSLRDLLSIIDRIEAKGAHFKSLTEPVDTSTAAGRMMMQMLGAFAEFERSLIRERSIAGQNAARLHGRLPGRRRSLNPFDEAECVNLYLTGWYTMDLIADMFNISNSAVKRAIYRITKPQHTSLL